jgi:hypothetical protein
LTFGEGDLFPHLRGEVPAGTLQGGVDVLAADVSLGEVFLVGQLRRFRRGLLAFCLAYYAGTGHRGQAFQPFALPLEKVVPA